MMKHIHIALTFLLVIFLSVDNQAQTTIFSENFNSAPNWTLNTPGASVIIGSAPASGLSNSWVINAVGTNIDGSDNLHITCSGFFCSLLGAPGPIYNASNGTNSNAAATMNTDITAATFTGGGPFTLSFQWTCIGASNPNNASGRLIYSTDGGITWVEKPTNYNGSGAVNTESIDMATLPGFTPGVNNIRLGFRWFNIGGTGHTDPPMIVDNIKITIPTSSNTITTGTVTGSPFCAGATLNLGFTSTGTFNAGNVYTAQLSDATGSFATPVAVGTLTSTANSGSIAVTIPGATASGTNYRIRVISSNPATIGTNNGVDFTITAPAVATFASIPSVCQGTTAPLLPASSTNTPAITGTWSPATISTTTPGTITYTFTPAAGQCGTGTTLDVTVTPPNITPTFAAIGPLCINSTAPTLPASSTNTPAITGTWSPATINTATAGTITYTFTPAAGQCATTTTLDIEVTGSITPTFAAIGPLCINSTAPLLPSSSTNTPAITGTWSPATISTATAGTTTYTFTPAAGQCAATATLDIEITSSITPTFATIGPLCLNSAAPALPTSSSNTPAITGTWSPATISTTTVGTTTYTFTANAGQCAANTTLDIVITNAITPTFAAIAPVCQGSTAPSLPTSSTNPFAITGTWNPAVINTASIGTLTYTFTPDAGQCGAVVSIDVEVIPTPPAPAITIAANITTICAGESVNFTATPNSSNTGDVIQWFVNGVAVTGGTGLLFSSTTLTNNAQVTAVFTPSSSCLAGQTATSNVVLITVNPSTAASISINATNTQICAGESVTFNATANGGGATPSIQWLVNSNAVAGATGPTFTTTTLSDNDIVSATITSNLPCVVPNTATSAGITIIVLPSGAPTITISADRNTICVGQVVQFTALSALGGGAPQYQWQINGTTVQTNTTGTFTANNLNANATVTCVLNSNYQCATSASATSNTLTIQVNPVPTVDLSADVTIEEGESTTLIATTGANLNYVWTPSESLSCSNCVSPVATPEMTTVYSFTVTDPASNCAANDSVKVTVIRNFDIWVPSAFSPNGDNQNDVFKVRGNNIKEFNITIYDRWGLKLYESSNLTEVWDGEFNNRRVNTGIVVYVLTYVLNDGTSETRKGNITISN